MANPPRPRGAIPTPKDRLAAAPPYAPPEADAAEPPQEPPADAPDRPAPRDETD